MVLKGLEGSDRTGDEHDVGGSDGEEFCLLSAVAVVGCGRLWQLSGWIYWWFGVVEGLGGMRLYVALSPELGWKFKGANTLESAFNGAECKYTGMFIQRCSVQIHWNVRSSTPCISTS